MWREELDAALKDLNASAALYRATERRQAITKVNAEADAIEARIKELDEKQEKGYWLCENGDEDSESEPPVIECDDCRKKPGSRILCADCLRRRDETATHGRCRNCDALMKFIRTDLMTGQEKYESEKERKEAEGMVEANRQAAAQHEEAIKGHEDTATMFRKQAQQAREFAELLRKL